MNIDGTCFHMIDQSEHLLYINISHSMNALQTKFPSNMFVELGVDVFNTNGHLLASWSLQLSFLILISRSKWSALFKHKNMINVNLICHWFVFMGDSMFPVVLWLLSNVRVCSKIYTRVLQCMLVNYAWGLSTFKSYLTTTEERLRESYNRFVPNACV